jgi:hypothetical protein
VRAIEGETCEASWLAAAQYLLACHGHEQHNLIVEVAQPTQHSPQDRRIRGRIDDFLRNHDAQPLATVAETIFPAAEYRSGGSLGVYETYPNEIYPAIKQPNEWGRYAHRLLRRSGPDGTEINPLKIVVEKLQSQLTNGQRMRCCYELSVSEGALDLPLYDGTTDSRRVRGGPCLSHISLKIGRNNYLYLTALYRSHYYIERALGNLLGLAALQAFVCEQVGLVPGPLVCVSTFAQVDTERWNLSAVRQLISDLRELANSNPGV